MALQPAEILVPKNVIVSIHCLDNGGEPEVTGQCIVDVSAVDGGDMVLSAQRVNLSELIDKEQLAYVIEVMTTVRKLALEILPKL